MSKIGTNVLKDHTGQRFGRLVVNTPTLAKAEKWSLTSDEIIDALEELVDLAEYGTARITLFANGGGAVAIGSDHAQSKFVGKTAEEALRKAQAAILRGRR